MADRADRRQRFTAKTEMTDIADIITGHFGRCMTLHGKGEIISAHADTVIIDNDAAKATTQKTYIDLPRAGIDSVLDQFLDRTCGLSTTSPAAIWLITVSGSRRMADCFMVYSIASGVLF